MILFVFEGSVREPLLFNTIQKLFLPKETEPFICTYNSNIYSLYAKLKQYDVFDDIQTSGNTVSILNEILESKGDHTLSNIIVSDVSQIYLFFDYDFHESRYTLDDNNIHIQEMLDFFCDETDNGKLYINYPMVDAIRYTKQLPDNNYLSYTVSRNVCKQFKRIVSDFSFYPSFDFLLMSNNDNEKEESKERRLMTVRENWIHLIRMNVNKANYLCNDIELLPYSIDDIEQRIIFKNQLKKFVNTENCCVSILNAFPIFIFEYCGKIPS